MNSTDAIIILSHAKKPETKSLHKPLKGSQESLFLGAWTNFKGTQRTWRKEKKEENMSRKRFKKLGRGTLAEEEAEQRDEGAQPRAERKRKRRRSCVMYYR